MGCAGNVNIKASENGGTIAGYKIGTVKIENYGKERVYPDPRSLFFDSDFEKKLGGEWSLFKHGTLKKNNGPVVDESVQSLIQGAVGKTMTFDFTGYGKFYDEYGKDAATFGHPETANESTDHAIELLKKKGPPKMGCPMCIADYVMGIPGVLEIAYKQKDLIDICGGRHEYGFQRFNPKDPSSPRGVFNISTGDFNKISMGDGHAIDTGFMSRDYASSSIGGLVFSSNGSCDITIGKNQHKVINADRPNGLTNDNYIHVDTPFDFIAPDSLNDYIKKIGDDYKLVGRGEKYVSPLENGDIQLARDCIGENSKAPNDDPISKNMGTAFRHLEVMPIPKWDDSGYWNRHQFTIGNKRIIDEKIDNRDMIDYGFNFEQAKERICSKRTSDLCVNFYENEQFSRHDYKFLDDELLEGGNERWFQIKRFDEMEHVEVSASAGKYYYTFVDLSKNHVKTFKFHDCAYAWWDNNLFNADRVRWFPDSEFETYTYTEDSYAKSGGLDGVINASEHKCWSKYGNHICAPKHPTYSALNSGCGAAYTKAKNFGDPMENLVDYPGDLWVHKKGAGVRHNDTIVCVATPHPNRFALNQCTCGNNQKISVVKYFEAPTALEIDEKFLTNGNNIQHSEYNGDINDRSISFTGAVNKHVTTLNSDHVALIKDDQNDDTAYATTEFTMCSANEYKTILKGNQKFLNYSPTLDTSTATIKHSEYSNNFEFSQNGFPVNRFKLLNGTDTALGDAGEGKGVEGITFVPAQNPPSAKHGDNEMIVLNGGMTDAKPSEKNSLESSTNNFKLANGAFAAGTSDNSINVENGIGVVVGGNYTSFTNGSILNDGENIFKISNDGMVGGSNVTNFLMIENDHFQEYCSMHDQYKNAKIINPALVIRSSAGELRELANTHIVSSPDVKLYSTNLTVNSTGFTGKFGPFVLKSTGIDMQTTRLNIVGDVTKIGGNTIGIEAPTVILNNVTSIGSHQGTFTGHFQGSAMDDDAHRYSTQWVTENSGVEVKTEPGIISPLSKIKPVKASKADVSEIAKYDKAGILAEILSFREISKKVRKAFTRFLDLELECLKDLNSLKRN